MVGIATATSISWIGFCLTLFFEIKHKYGFYPIKRALIKIGLVALLPVALTYAIAQTFGQTILAMVVAGFLFVIIYGGLLILTRAFDEKDWSIVRSIKSKIISKTSSFSA
jgi:O-antigen/teichoic acid export membrane protein